MARVHASCARTPPHASHRSALAPRFASSGRGVCLRMRSMCTREGVQERHTQYTHTHTHTPVAPFPIQVSPNPTSIPLSSGISHASVAPHTCFRRPRPVPRRAEVRKWSRRGHGKGVTRQDSRSQTRLEDCVSEVRHRTTKTSNSKY